MSVLNKHVSYYPSKNATTHGKDRNLLTILQSDEHKEIILTLRASPAEVQKQLKDQLPCYTITGTFSRRCKEGLIQPSGLACVDLDSAEDYDIIYLLNELKKIHSIAYTGLSCRGKRLFSIVLFKYPDKYEKQYERLIQSFNAMGLPMGDECHKQISQPRFVSWNDNTTQFFNHTAKPYPLLPLEKTHHYIKPSCRHTGAAKKPLEIAAKMIREAIDGEKFYKLRDASYMLGGYTASGIVDEAEALNLLKSAIKAKPNVQDLKAAFRTIEKCFVAGKLKPLS